MEVNSYMTRLKKQGFKLTGQRRRIIEILLQEDRYISARELIELLSADYPTISFDTVYRNLRTMRDEHILEESMFDDGSSRFRISCEQAGDEGHHHHHFICLQCGATQSIACPVNQIEDAPEGFEVAYHRFEVFGTCGSCRKKSADSQ